ncbi:MAG: hypothetical protein ACE5D0_09920 [Fidelibacterota bacterium]
MTHWKSAIGLGILMWLIPFVVAFLIFPIRESSRPLFESVMAIAVSGSAVVLGLKYLKQINQSWKDEAVLLGFLWFIICIAIDAPLMLFGGPMEMTIEQYMDDIGITYLIIPVITWGIGVARSCSTDQ